MRPISGLTAAGNQEAERKGAGGDAAFPSELVDDRRKEQRERGARVDADRHGDEGHGDDDPAVKEGQPHQRTFRRADRRGQPHETGASQISRYRTSAPGVYSLSAENDSHDFSIFEARHAAPPICHRFNQFHPDTGWKYSDFPDRPIDYSRIRRCDSVFRADRQIVTHQCVHWSPSVTIHLAPTT